MILKQQLICHIWSMPGKQLLVLKTDKKNGKNQVFILHFLYKITWQGKFL